MKNTSVNVRPYTDFCILNCFILMMIYEKIEICKRGSRSFNNTEIYPYFNGVFFVFEYKERFETNQFQITAYSVAQRSLHTRRSTSCI
jgi:hypothetical protein